MALTRADLVTSSNLAADDDYQAILSVLLATVRGRRFLTEYARRARQSDIQLILAEISKLTCDHRDELFDFKSLAQEKLSD